MTKLTLTLLLSVPMTCIIEMIDKYLYCDWEFARALVILIVLDTILSIVKHLIHKDASSEDFWKGTSKKCFVYLILMFTADVVSNYTVRGEKIAATCWLGDYLCVAMVVREFISIVENSNGIIPWLPKAVLSRLKDFSEEGKYLTKY